MPRKKATRKKTPTRANEPYFKSIAECARAFGVVGTTINVVWAKKGFPKRVPGKGFPAKESILWWAENIFLKNYEPDIDPQADSLELLRTANNAELRKMKARSDLERVNVRIARERELALPVDQIRAVHDRFAIILRTASEQLLKHHGEDAHEIVNEAIDECQSLIDDAFPLAPTFRLPSTPQNGKKRN